MENAEIVCCPGCPCHSIAGPGLLSQCYGVTTGRCGFTESTRIAKYDPQAGCRRCGPCERFLIFNYAAQFDRLAKGFFRP
jgi:hypothetical protein